MRDELLKALEERKTADKALLSRLTARATKELALEKARDRARLSPKPTHEGQALEEARLQLAELRILLDDKPIERDELASMENDINALRTEAGGKYTENLKEWVAFNEALTAYKALTATARSGLREASVALSAEDLDDFGEAIEKLTDLDKAIEKAAEALRKAYEALSVNLENEIAYAERHQSGEALETGEMLLMGFNPGETGAMFKARLVKVDLADEFPPTLEKIDEVVEEAERRWQMVATMSPWEMENIKKNFYRTMTALFERSAFATNMDIGTLDTLLREGEWRKTTPFDPRGMGGKMVKSGYGGNHAWRRFTELQFKTDERLSMRFWEKYGLLHSELPSESDTDLGGEYGDIVVRWHKPSVATTFFCGNSLCLQRNSLNYCACSLTSLPSPCSFSPECKKLIDALKRGPLTDITLDEFQEMLRIPYVELQFHGANSQTLDAMDSVSFATKDEVRALTAKAVERLAWLNVDVYIGGRPADIGEKGEITYTDGDSDSDDSPESGEEAEETITIVEGENEPKEGI